MSEFGMFVGRVSPIHLGHERVIDHMIETHGIDDTMVVIGSSNTAPSMRHFFSYSDRRAFVKALYPDIRVVGLPDYPNDDEWLLALDDIVASTGRAAEDARFFGGCDEDVRFFTNAGRSVTILNRFDGTTPKISATEVRDCL